MWVDRFSVWLDSVYSRVDRVSCVGGQAFCVVRQGFLKGCSGFPVWEDMFFNRRALFPVGT